MDNEKIVFKTSQESGDFVVAAVEKVHEIIKAEVDKIDSRHQFLVLSRIVLLIFQSHFKLTYEAAEACIKKQEAKVTQ